MENMNLPTLFTEASLTDSVIYKSFNRNSELMTLIITAIKESIKIDSSYIQEQLLQIKRTRISPFADEVLQAYNNGTIVLLYSKGKKVPQALPFFATKSNGKICVFIFVNNYGTISSSDRNSEEKYLNISMKDLYVLMEGAYTSYKYAINPTKITKSLGLMKISTKIYVSMITRILNKEYAIGMDTSVLYKVSFAIGLYFLRSVFMSTNNDVNFAYACDAIKMANEGVDRNSLLLVQDEFLENNVTTIEELITFIKSLSPRLSDINFRYFLQCYINTYKAGAIFGLECLPYFLYTIEASMIGSFLVNQPIISDITKNVKGMNTFYPELVKALS